MTFKLGTFSIAGCSAFPGMVVGERVLSLHAVASYLGRSGRQLEGYGSMQSLLSHWEHDFPLLEEVAEALEHARAPDLVLSSAPLAALCVGAPLPEPRHVYCSGANYKKHVVQLIVAQVSDETQGMGAEERRAFGERKMDDRARKGTPFFFLKSQSAVTGPFDPIVLPIDAEQPDWELELAVVIGRSARRVSRERALDYVAGYTIANDITRRERVNRKQGDAREMGMDWIASKCAPTFLPLGPYIIPAAFIGDPQSLRITLKLNGATMQDESTSDMIFGVARLLEHLSAIVELQPGDVICTGSPAGNGAHYGRFLRPGDVLEGSISGLGAQRNVCTREEP
jgi:2-keto-4-pentenoate hydratase/2-oxohepta-3-ene-1,7-dioic acid hydratase in catechol pathway